MKLIPVKFAIAIGSAFSALFLICNVFLSLAGNEVSAWVMNVLFHEIDFKPLMNKDGFHLSHLFCGIGICFIAGAILGIVTALIYNSISKRKMIEEHFSVFRKIIEEHVSFPVQKEEAEKSEAHTPIGFSRNN